MQYQKSQSKQKSRLIPSKKMVEIKAVTWNKDSHGLFDYENSYYDMRKFQIKNSVRLLRKENEIVCTRKSESEKSDSQRLQYLLSISQETRENSAKYFIDVPGDFPNQQTAPNQTYLIVRSLKCRDGRSQRGYSLMPGDVIKLGRIEYRVIEVQVDYGNTLNPKNKNSFEYKLTDCLFDVDNQIIPEEDKETENQNEAIYGGQNICKYCFSEDIDTNPLHNCKMYPCDCKRPVHYFCLKSWIKNKIITKGNVNIATYQWKKLTCEICLKPLPRKIKFQNFVHELITIEKPECPYIILEKISDDNNHPTLSIIVPEKGQTMKLGRGHQCDLRISDISVSRIHAHLKFEDGKFLIFDNDSKFGTLILLTDKYPVKVDKAAVQIGRTVFTFVIKNQQFEIAQGNEE